MNELPCSHCGVLTDPEFLNDCGQLGFGCGSLCERCEEEIAEDAEREWYASRPMNEAEGW